MLYAIQMWTQNIFQGADLFGISHILNTPAHKSVFMSIIPQIVFNRYSSIDVDVKTLVQGVESNSTGGRAWLRDGLQIHFSLVRIQFTTRIWGRLGIDC